MLINEQEFTLQTTHKILCAFKNHRTMIDFISNLTELKQDLLLDLCIQYLEQGKEHHALRTLIYLFEIDKRLVSKVYLYKTITLKIFETFE